jgi:hypothetical protein
MSVCCRPRHRGIPAEAGGNKHRRCLSHKGHPRWPGGIGAVDLYHNRLIPAEAGKIRRHAVAKAHRMRLDHPCRSGKSQTYCPAPNPSKLPACTRIAYAVRMAGAAGGGSPYRANGFVCRNAPKPRHGRVYTRPPRFRPERRCVPHGLAGSRS